MADQLPIYRLAAETAGRPKLIDHARRIFGITEGFKLSESGAFSRLRSGQRVVEIAPASGGVWAADEASLWKPSVRAELPSEAEALARADEYVRQRDLLPDLEAPFRIGPKVVGGTHFAVSQAGRRENRRLDVQVSYPILVGDLPLVGGGGDFTVIIGHRAEVIGFSGVWRPARKAFDARVIDPARADEQFRAMTKGMNVASFGRRLAYYSAPSSRTQEFLYPVYVYGGTALFGRQKVPLRQIILPATDFGPPVEFGPAQPPRKRSTRRRRPDRAEAPDERRSLLTVAASTPFEAGTSWIGKSGGLAGSPANAQGFVDEWAAAGWRINFNWGDGNAWESDWRREDDVYVDAADFVFYTGHANKDGWVLSNPDDGFLSFSEVGGAPGSPADLWGQNDLEWVTIAACGPLQDDLLSPGGGDVLDRWAGAFDGLHILMGYGAITFDNTDEGRLLAQYAKGGSSLIDAWFRAAKEVQPSQNGSQAPDGPTIYVGAMWVGRDGIDPSSDHAWGHGSVSADPTSPTLRACMWTMC
jgi:hypothetical protein